MEVRLEGISKAYGETAVLRNFSCAFSTGRVSCILGPSGCGKTTLLRLIAGLEAPDTGRILPDGQKKISAVFQENRLFENLSAEKNVLLTARRGFTRADARALLAELGLREDAGRRTGDLSGGMQRRVAIARALATDYALLLLDEPAAGLDGETRRAALETILRSAAGRTVICVTHEPEDAHILGAETLRLDSLSKSED